AAAGPSRLTITGGPFTVGNTNAGDVQVGNGVVTLSANAAALTANHDLQLGTTTNLASFVLSGGTVTVGNASYVGYSGSATFNQSGGSATVGAGLTVGDFNTGSGTVNLSGSAFLTVPDTGIFVGNGGNGVVNQSGGTLMTGTGVTEVIGNVGVGAYNQSN